MKTLTEKDIKFIGETGRSLESVKFQYHKLCEAGSLMKVQQPATLDNGIRKLQKTQRDELLKLHDEAASGGRVSSFIPASGSGTRLFKDLHQAYLATRNNRTSIKLLAEKGDNAIKETLKIVGRIEDLAIWSELRKRGCLVKNPIAILNALFADKQNAMSDLPKGLLPFHKYSCSEIRTAFEEHLTEAGMLHADANKYCNSHFTISRTHKALFMNAAREITVKLQHKTGVRFETAFSYQDPATYTIAIDSRGDLLRDAAGQLEFRPGGHGSLLKNLATCGGDIVLLKNIDNVSLEHYLADTLPVRKQLTGVLLQLETKIHQTIKQLRSGSGLSQAFDLLENQFGYRIKNRYADSYETSIDLVIDRLNRPLRVCGVVGNQGQPGGGPFWVDVGGYGRSLQIVESSQIDKNDSGQQQMLMASTHFNPVVMACALRDSDGRPYDLTRFTDPDAFIITEKTRQGEPIKIIEHPGLWCGSMAKWNTVFVEIPAMLFNPVKVLSDLLEDYHCNNNFLQGKTGELAA